MLGASYRVAEATRVLSRSPSRHKKGGPAFHCSMRPSYNQPERCNPLTNSSRYCPLTSGEGLLGMALLLRTPHNRKPRVQNEACSTLLAYQRHSPQPLLRQDPSSKSGALRAEIAYRGAGEVGRRMDGWKSGMRQATPHNIRNYGGCL